MNVTINKVDLIDIERAWQSIIEEYTLFSSALGSFTKMDHNTGSEVKSQQMQEVEIN